MFLLLFYFCCNKVTICMCKAVNQINMLSQTYTHTYTLIKTTNRTKFIFQYKYTKRTTAHTDNRQLCVTFVLKLKQINIDSSQDQRQENQSSETMYVYHAVLNDLLWRLLSIFFKSHFHKLWIIFKKNLIVFFAFIGRRSGVLGY